MSTIEWPPYYSGDGQIRSWWTGASSPAAQGWQCPVCKAVYAPLVPCCVHCKPQQITYGTSTTTDGRIK